MPQDVTVMGGGGAGLALSDLSLSWLISVYSHSWEINSDGPKQISAEFSAEVSAEISAETEISVIRTEISVYKHYKEISFYSKLLTIFVFKKSKKMNILPNYQY